MSDTSAIPILVLTRQQDDVEFINRVLRNAGHAVHCHWIEQVSELHDALSQINIHLIFAVVGTQPEAALALLNATQQLAPSIPTLLIREQVDETIMTQDLKQGARDVVSLKHPQRLQAVASRELHHFKLQRQLSSALNSTHQYYQQMQQLMAGSVDAIVLVQEGIMLNPNAAWLTLLGQSHAEAMEGNPVLDCFEADSHHALKGALAACMQGKWTGHPLKINARLPDGSSLPVELLLQEVDIDDEPAVQLKVPAQRQDQRPMEVRIHDALSRDATTGMLQWKYFIEQVSERLAQPIKAGVRELVCIAPENFATILHTLGPAHSEAFMAHFIKPIKEQLQSHDLAGRFGSSHIVVLLERGTRDDIAAWCANALRRMREQPFTPANGSLAFNGTAAHALITSQPFDLNQVLASVLPDLTTPQTMQASLPSTSSTEENTLQVMNDKLWVKLIKSALMDNRFRLLQQPIITLSGDHKSMFDVLIRMLDEANEEVLPSEFLAAAERNDLMKNIDRWVIGAAMSYCNSSTIDTLLVRLSQDSVVDQSLLTWLKGQLQVHPIKPAQLIFQISETVTNQQLRATVNLARQLKQAGFGFALEHAGRSPNTLQLLNHLPMDFLKLDGTLIQTLATDPNTQALIGRLVNAATKHGIRTIAERVEDANTMAALWQLGVDYIQGYFVREPERLTLE